MNLIEYFNRGIDYSAYMPLFEEAVRDGKTSGPIQTEEYVFYTKLNWKRSQRLEEHTRWLQPEVVPDRARYSGLAALCLTEFWCGDAAQNIPVIQKLADEYYGFPIHYLFRDENLELMDAFLTNGGRSIPKYILFDRNTGLECAQWGPRPAVIQQVMTELKASGVPKETMLEQVQRAYNADRSASVQKEWFDLLTNLNL